MASAYMNQETGARTTRHVLPSRIRRGRMATEPVWRTTLESGQVWQFRARRDALAFAAAGGCRHGETWCLQCRGHRIDVGHGG